MRQYIQVAALFDGNGHLMPQSIIWNSQKSYPISRVHDIRYLYKGEKELIVRYTCEILGRTKVIFYDEATARWYLYLEYRSKQ